MKKFAFFIGVVIGIIISPFTLIFSIVRGVVRTCRLGFRVKRYMANNSMPIIGNVNGLSVYLDKGNRLTTMVAGGPNAMALRLGRKRFIILAEALQGLPKAMLEGILEHEAGHHTLKGGLNWWVSFQMITGLANYNSPRFWAKLTRQEMIADSLAKANGHGEELARFLESQFLAMDNPYFRDQIRQRCEALRRAA